MSISSRWTTRLAAALAATLTVAALGACSQPAFDATPAMEQVVQTGSAAPSEGASYEELLAERLEKGTIGTAGAASAASELGKVADGQDVGTALEPQQAAPAQPQTKSWTVLVYVVGTNLESENGQASADIDEMAAAGIDFANANVLYLTGGCNRWEKDIPNDRNVVWSLETGEAVAVSAANSMGEPATLADFVNFADTYYPAKHVALVFWDHGGGPVTGFGQDELAEGDGLSLPEMAAAMQATRYHDNAKLDIVGFDACLMGSVEVASVWQDYARWMVGSEEVEAGLGWDWGFLATLNDNPKPQQLCEAIVSKFESSYRLTSLVGLQADYTLSALDLSKVSAVREAVDELATALEYDVDAGDYSKVNEARTKTTQFGVVSERGSVMYFDLFDLAGFASQFAETLPAEAGKVTQAVSRMVACQTSNIAGTSGVSIYFPSNNQGLWEMSAALMGTPMGDAYRSLTAAYAKRWEQELGINWSLTELDLSKAPAEAALSDDGTEYLVPLSDEQLESLDYASYAVLSFEDGGYRPLMSEVRVTPDDDGTLHIPVDPEVATLTSSSLETPLLLSAQQMAIGGRERYICPAVRLFAEDASDQQDAADISLLLDRGTDGALTLVGAPFQQDDVVVSRANAILEDYAAISSLLGYAYTPTRDDASELLPHTMWDQAKDSTFAYQWTTLDESIAFQMQPASELGLDVACQVTLTDHTGTKHATELFELT